jgi:hypothetical protein
MRLIDVIKARWDQRRAGHDYCAVDHVAGHLFRDYAQAVHNGSPRRVLAEILTGLAGCELALSRLNPAMGWGMDADEDGCTVGESARRGGLLVQEISYAAGEDDYRGVRAVEFQCDDIAEDLRNVTLAYRGWVLNPRGNLGAPTDSVPVGQRLGELWHVVVEVIGGQAAEVLVPLMDAHGYDPYQRDCDKHHGDTVESS